MRSLHLRNVPDEVVERLERMAERESMSVTAVAVRELAQASLRVDNVALLDALPHLELETAAVVHAVEAGRADR